MFYLLFLFYLIGICWLITRIPFFKNTGLTRGNVTVLFLIRVVVSTLVCYSIINFSVPADTLTFQRFGIEEYHLLLSNPKEYLLNSFTQYDSNSYSRFFEVSNSFWNDLRSTIIIKMLSIMNIFSGENLYINTLFFNFIVFFGVVALYKVAKKVFTQPKWGLIFCIFILPSALIFSSNIHREGLILLSLSFIVYHMYFGLNEPHFAKKRMLYIVINLLFILLLRNFLFPILLASLASWVLAHKRPKYSLAIFSSIFAFCIFCFFLTSFISPKIDLPRYVVERQEKFIEISDSANSSVEIPQLQNSVKSFISLTPEAIGNAFTRPYLTDFINGFYIPFSIEIFVYGLLFLLLIFFRKKNIKVPPITYFFIFLSCSILIITGYIVPIIGAIIRYRSIYLILLLLPVISYTDWEKLRTLSLKIYKLFFNKVYKK